MTFTCIAEPFHVWEGSNGRIMVSDERVKALRPFATVDDAINALFLEGCKETARTVNRTWQSHKASQLKAEAESRRYYLEAARRGYFIAAPFDRD